MGDKIAKLLIIVGLTLTLGSLSLKIYSKSMENRAIKNFENKISNEKSSEPIKNPKLGDEIAIIKIPSIKLNTAVVHGIENKYLKHYVCHFETSAMPGQNGNFSLAGHSSYMYNEVFNELYKVKVDDKIIIKTFNDDFIYKITNIFETDSKDLSVLEQNMDKKEITLVTCTNDGKDRLIVKGELTTK